MHAGGIVKHTSKLTFSPPGLCTGVELTGTWQSSGRRDWEAWRHYPVLGMSAHWFDLGTEELGQSMAVFPFVDVPLLRKTYGQLYFQVGSGLAWLTNPYDRLRNPQQNAIGSRLNNVSAFRIHVDVPIHASWRVSGGFSFTHYSNGQAQTPNYGINILGGMLGLQWTPVPLQPEDYKPASAPKTSLRSWGWSMHGGMAFREIYPVGGPRYPVYIGSLAGMYQLSRVNRLLFGLEYEYHRSQYVHSKLNWQNYDEASHHRAAGRVMVFGGEEFMFGSWAVLLQAGIYLPVLGEGVPFPVYTKLATRYYLPALPRSGARFFTGVYLKSHLVTAEYISLGMGVTFE